MAAILSVLRYPVSVRLGTLIFGTHTTGGGGVTEGNVMQYLGVIEQRTNEILQMYAAVQTQQEGVPAAGSLVEILGQVFLALSFLCSWALG